MTITLTRQDTTPQATASAIAIASASAAAEAEAVLRHVARAMGVVAQRDPDLFHSHTAAGRAVVDLADAARAAAAVLGQDAGQALTTGAGVVVVRDLVAAQDHLQRAVDRGRTGAPEVLLALRRRADLAYGRFLVSVPAPA